MSHKFLIAVPPIVTVHPQSKMRISGDRVTLCCDGEGNPAPEFEWFKDDNIIDKDIYYYDKNLEISNVTGMMGKYRCRLVNDYGSEFSDVADLRVFSKANASSPGCNPTPRSKNTTLPTGCVVNGTTSNIIDVGECRPTPCLQNDSILSKRTCQDENFCCTVAEVSDVTVNCGSSITFAVSKASRCDCQKCAKPKLLITGIVVGRKGQTEKPITYSDLTFENFKYRTKGDGSFSFEVLTGKKRLSVVFKDTYHNEYADLTKVFHIENGKTLFSKIVLRPKPEPRLFNSSEPFKVQLGQGKNDKGFAEMIISKDSLLKDDGTPFSGQANLRLNVVNPRNMSDMETAPGDFSTIDEEGEEQMLVSSGMLNLDFEDDGGKKLSPFKPIKLYLDPEKLNISVDSNGNTTTKLWWLDSKTGRWVAASDVRMVKKISSKAKRSPTHFLLETEIVPSISRQGQFNIDVVTNFGAVRVKAPGGSSIRILCEEPNVTPPRYTGYLEETVGAPGFVCITVWIDRKCYMQGESSSATYLEPEQPDDFPASISAAVIRNSNIQGSNSGVTFSFNVKTLSDGPIFPRNQNDFRNCRNAAGLKQFEFNPPPASLGFNLQSVRVDNPRNSRNWYPEDFACFIKILANGARSSVFLASSHRPNKRDKYGDSAAMAQKVQGSNAFVACVEIRCPGNVYHPNRTPDQIPEWTYVLVTHLTGNCDFQKNFLPNQDDLDNKGTQCPTRSKRHSPGSETWLCVPLPTSGFDIDLVYTGDKNDLSLGKNRCLNGNKKWSQGKTNQINTNGPTVEFSCS